MFAILFLDKIFNKVSSIWRVLLFICKTKKHGVNYCIYGKIHHINKNIIVGNNIRIYPGVQFFGDGIIKIGNNVSIGNNTLIYSSKNAGVCIGDNTQIAAQCYIIDTDHGTDKGTLIQNQKNNSKSINIGNDVWIAANCTILKGSNISDGAIVGDKSLAKGNIKENSISIGILAKHIKNRGEYFG